MTRRWTCSPPCWARTGRRLPPRRPDARLAWRLYSSRRPASPVRIDRPRTVRCGCATVTFPDRLDLQPDGTRKQRRRAAAARRWTACGWTAHRRTRAPACAVRGRAGPGRRRPLPLRGTGRRTDRGRCRRRALRRLLGLPRAGPHGSCSARSEPMSGCCPARVRSTTRRPATGRWPSDATDRAGSRGHGRLLAGPPPGLHTRRLTTCKDWSAMTRFRDRRHHPDARTGIARQPQLHLESAGSRSRGGGPVGLRHRAARLHRRRRRGEARAGGASRSRSAGFALSGHMDTVPDTGWQQDPWSARLDADGVLHGLGSTDMKGPVAAAIVAARALPERCRSPC